MIWIIPYMAITSGWSGGSLIGHKLFGRFTFIPEILFSLGFAAVYYPHWYCIVVAAWSYAWQQSSPAPALHWGDPKNYNPQKKSTLKPFVDLIAKFFGWKPWSVEYCRLYIGVKGFLITLPIGGAGAIYYPLAYEIGSRMKNNTVRECGAGLGCGLNIYLM